MLSLNWANRRTKLLIVAITGMPGAGKSTAAQGLVGLGWKRVVMGDIIREETKKRGLVPDSKNTGEVMKDLRAKLGDAAVARLCLEQISELGSEKLVVDGVRSMVEVEEFRKAAHVLLVAVHASPQRRFALLKERGRKDDPLTIDMFLERDSRELSVGVSTAIALANEVVSNEHNTSGGLSKQMTEVVNRWLVIVAP
jgi:dephospho-CoA kinase